MYIDSTCWYILPLKCFNLLHFIITSQTAFNQPIVLPFPIGTILAWFNWSPGTSFTNRFNFHPSMDKYLHLVKSVGWNHTSILSIAFWEETNNFASHFTGHVITYPCWDPSQFVLVKGASGRHWGISYSALHVSSFGQNPSIKNILIDELFVNILSNILLPLHKKIKKRSRDYIYGINQYKV